MSPHHAIGLAGFAARDGHEIKYLHEMFPRDTPDPEWIDALKTDGERIVISGDEQITRSPIKKAAWRESGLTAFFFAAPFPTDSYWKQVKALISWWPEIVAQARSTPRGHAFKLPKKGRRCVPLDLR